MSKEIEVDQEVELTAFRLIRCFKKVINPQNSMDVNSKNCAIALAEYVLQNVVTHSVDKALWKQVRDTIDKL